MGRKRKRCLGDICSGSKEDLLCMLNGAGNDISSSSDHHQYNDVLSTGQIHLLEKFVNFCKIKKARLGHKCAMNTGNNEINYPKHSEFSASYFATIIQSLTPHQRE